MTTQEIRAVKDINGDDAWWLDSANIARLLRYLDKTDCLDVQICIDVCEKPWHWGQEYDEMLAYDREHDAKQGRFDYVRGG